MIVEPVPTNPRSPLRRAASVAGLVVPPLLLVAVIGGGLLGQPGTPPSPTASAPPAGAPTAAPEPAELRTRVVQRASFPAAIDGLQVHNVAETLALRAGDGATGIVAVAGYLSLDRIPPACGGLVLGPSGALCHRDGVVSDSRESPWTPSRTDWAQLEPHFHPEFPPGVRLPAQIELTTKSGDGPPLPVVLLGRFDDPRAAPCGPARRDCDPFVARGVAWYDGEVWRRPTVLEPTVDFDVVDDPWPEQRAIAVAALGAVDRVLVIAFVGPATLARVDPNAGLRLPEPAPDRVWYVLGLEVVPGPRPGEPVGRTRWVVVDAATGERLAAGGDPGALHDAGGSQAE